MRGQYRNSHYLDKDGATSKPPASCPRRRASSNRYRRLLSRFARSTGSSAGACHRAALCADPLADDDGRDSNFKQRVIGKHSFAISRATSPEVCQKFPCPQIRGRREYRVRAAPAVSCAKSAQKNAHEHTGSAEAIRHSLRNGFTAYFVLSPATGLFCHRRPRKLPFANLTPASGRQDHTSSPSASHAVRLLAHPRPPHPAPRP